jgi:hypothetical protein
MRLLDTIFCSFLWICLFGPGNCAQAQFQPFPLKNGMSFYEVLKNWGTPLEKRQHESLHEEIWVYNSGKIIFQDGKVVAWTIPSAHARRAGDGQIITGLTPSAEQEQDRKKAEEILGEILKDIPQGSSGEKPATRTK